MSRYVLLLACHCVMLELRVFCSSPTTPITGAVDMSLISGCYARAQDVLSYFHNTHYLKSGHPLLVITGISVQETDESE